MLHKTHEHLVARAVAPGEIEKKKEMLVNAARKAVEDAEEALNRAQSALDQARLEFARVKAQNGHAPA